MESQAVHPWSLIVAVKDHDVFRNTLLRSQDVGPRCEVIPREEFSSAAKAYNSGIAQASHEILVFAHTDVYFPDGWFEKLNAAIAHIEATDPNWGTLGVCGISSTNEIVGHVYSTGSGVVFGQAFDEPIEAVSLDEMVLVLRRSAGLRFDEQLPGFHLYGTDICLEAQSRGMKNYVVSAFCIHNSNGIGTLPPAFWEAYGYMRKKWWGQLPVRTCCTEISRLRPPVLGALRSSIRRAIGTPGIGKRSSDPEKLYRELSQQLR